MFFFFFFDIEKRIGLKRLSDADLGLSGSSNQTHIGLYNDVLTFLDDNVVTTAMLICGDYCQMLDCFFGRIEKPEGGYRSAKIRTGRKGSGSVVSKIREFALKDKEADWYLLWSGLENKDLVFWLINSHTDEFGIIKELVDSNVHIITDEDNSYIALKENMVNKINQSSINIQKEIEIISQTNTQSRRFKPFDIEKARKQFAFVGKRGEELINEYLEKEKAARKITSFEWMNKSKESGLPYDFMIESNHSLKQYVDVKSTRFDFTQNIVFSNQEANFVHQLNNEALYSVYRVFDLAENAANLKICSQCLPYMTLLNTNVQKFKENILKSKTALLGMNISVSPTDCFKQIQSTIKL